MKDPTSIFRRFFYRIQRFLTPQRLTYAFLAGGVLWLSWLISVLFGPGYVDLAGQAIGTDYVQFYAAGKTLLHGESAHLYDMEFQSQLEQAIIGPELASYHAFINPPFFAALFAPLAALPYGISFAVWSLLSLLMLWGSVYLLNQKRPLRPFLWSLTWFPAFATISFGQNALLSLFLLTSVYVLWQRERRFLAGLVLGLLMYKPQLTLGVGLLWLLRWRKDWLALSGFALSTLGLVAISFGLLPEAGQAYFTFAREVLPDLPGWKEFPLWHLHTVRGFWRMLLPLDILADFLTLGCTVGGLVAFWKLIKAHPLTKALTFAGATCLTLWITPHAMIYDWAVLLVPAVLFWRELGARHTELRTLYALIWLAAFLSGPLTLLQWRTLPFAIQISVPVLAFSFYEIYGYFMAESRDGALSG